MATTDTEERAGWSYACLAISLLLFTSVTLGVVFGVTDGLDASVRTAVNTWASPGLTPSAAAQVDALLVPAWPTTEASAELVRRAAATGLPVDAYVSVLPPSDPAALPAHVSRLRAAGASRISLYHLGLAAGDRQELLAALR